MMKHEKKWVTFENGAKTLYGVIHMPVDKDPFPGVVIFHGFGGNKCGKHRLYVREAMKLVEAGIAVLRFDFRGAGDSDGDFCEVDLDSEVSDAIRGVDYLSNLPSVDSSRIGLLGRSLGGAIAVLVASQLDHVKSLALWAPVFSAHQWREEWQQAQQEKTSHFLDEGYVAFEGQLTNVSFVEQFFAMRLEENIKRLGHLPLIHFHGEQDTKVNLQHAAYYEKYRSDATAPSRFIRLANSDHDFDDVKDQELLLDETSRWFKETLI